MSDTPTTEDIAQHYKAMGDSVDLINAVIAGTQLADDTVEGRKDCVDRNVRHLEVMVTRDYWTTEDMTASNAAITAGKNYIAS